MTTKFLLAVGDFDPDPIDLRGDVYSASWDTGPWLAPTPDGNATMALTIRVTAAGGGQEAAYNRLARKLETDAPRGADPQQGAESNIVIIQRIGDSSHDAYIDVVGWDPHRNLYRGGFADYAVTLKTRAYARGAPIRLPVQQMPNGGGAVWLGEIPGVYAALARVLAWDVSTANKRVVSFAIGQHAGSLLEQDDQTPLIAAHAYSPAVTHADPAAAGGSEARLTATDGSWKPVARFPGPTGGRHNRRARAYVRARSAVQVIGTPDDVSVVPEQGIGNLPGGDWVYLLANIDANGKQGPYSTFATTTIYHVPTVRIHIEGAEGGTYQLEFAGETTVPLDLAATITTVQNALENLATIGVGNVTVLGPGATDDVYVWGPTQFSPPTDDLFWLTPQSFDSKTDDQWYVGFSARAPSTNTVILITPPGTSHTLARFSMDIGQIIGDYNFDYSPGLVISGIFGLGYPYLVQQIGQNIRLEYRDGGQHNFYLGTQYPNQPPGITYLQYGGQQQGYSGSVTRTATFTWNGIPSPPIDFTVNYSTGFPTSIVAPSAAVLQFYLQSAWGTDVEVAPFSGSPPGFYINFVRSLGRTAQNVTVDAPWLNDGNPGVLLQHQVIGGTPTGRIYNGTDTAAATFTANGHTTPSVLFSINYSAGVPVAITSPTAAALQTVLRNAWGAGVDVTLVGVVFSVHLYGTDLGRKANGVSITRDTSGSPPAPGTMVFGTTTVGGSVGVGFTGQEVTKYTLTRDIQASAEITLTINYVNGWATSIASPDAYNLQILLQQAWGAGNVLVTEAGVNFYLQFVGAYAGAPQTVIQTQSPLQYAGMAIFHAVVGAPPGDRTIAISGPYAPSGTPLRPVSALEGPNAQLTITPLLTGDLWRNHVRWTNGAHAVATAVWAMRTGAPAAIPHAALWYKSVVGYTTEFVHSDPDQGTPNSPPPGVMPDIIATQVRMASGVVGSAMVVAATDVVDLSGDGRYEWRDLGPVSLPPTPVRQGLGAPAWFGELQATNPGTGGDTIDCDGMIYVDESLSKVTAEALDLITPGLLWDYATDPDLRPSCDLYRETALIANGTFEGSADGWEIPFGATFVRSTAEHHTGAASGLFSSAAAGARLRNIAPYTWAAGDDLVGEFWLKGPAGIGGTLFLADGERIFAQRAFETTGAWQALYIEDRADTTTSAGYCGIVATELPVPIAWYVDDAAFFRREAAASASPSGPLLLGPGNTSLVVVPSVSDEMGGAVADPLNTQLALAVEVVPRYPIAAED